jgi:hypothetical protein
MFLPRPIWAVVRGRFAKKADLLVPVPHEADGEISADGATRRKHGIFGLTERWGLVSDEVIGNGRHGYDTPSSSLRSFSSDA